MQTERLKIHPLWDENILWFSPHEIFELKMRRVDTDQLEREQAYRKRNESPSWVEEVVEGEKEL